MAIGTTVTANTAATAVVNTIGGFAKEVVYSVSDTAEAIAGASDAARGDAVNITATSAATVDQATTIESASKLAQHVRHCDSAENLAGSTEGF